MSSPFSSLTMQQSKYVAYALIAAVVVLMLAPPQYQMYLPQTDMQTKQIVSVVAIVIAYYFYNGQKFSS